MALPERLVAAQQEPYQGDRISVGAVMGPRQLRSRQQVLDEAITAIAKAKFTGKADKEEVPQMLAEFEWVIQHALEQALDPSKSGAVVRPQRAHRSPRVLPNSSVATLPSNPVAASVVNTRALVLCACSSWGILLDSMLAVFLNGGSSLRYVP